MNRLLFKFTLIIASNQIFLAANALRVLGLFPHPGSSHFQVFHPVMRSVAAAGHDVTVISYFPDKNPLPKYNDLRLTGLEVLKDVVDLKVSFSFRLTKCKQ